MTHIALGSCVAAFLAMAGHADTFVPLESDVLRIVLRKDDASFQVLVKSSGSVWEQRRPDNPYRIADMESATDGLSASGTIERGGSTLKFRIALERDVPEFVATVEAPGKIFSALPPYPYPFAPQRDGEYYVQNTSGDGLLFPFSEMDKVRKPYSFAGSVPWFGTTDLRKGCMSILESFHLSEAGEQDFLDDSIYENPIRIRYAFLADGGYVGMAKRYRNSFLKRYPDRRPLIERAKLTRGLDAFKDGVYVYFWDEARNNPSLMAEMKAAGIRSCVAMFYGHADMGKETCDAVHKLGWTGGLYHMPAGNLFQVADEKGWPRKLLLGEVDSQKFFAVSPPKAWERICPKAFGAAQEEKIGRWTRRLGPRVFYFDTFVVQLAPCIHPNHPCSVQENVAERSRFLKNTSNLGVVVGSGEGNAPSWAIPCLDFFEGPMVIRSYGEAQGRIPNGGYKADFGTKPEVPRLSMSVDEVHRIPLFELMFHDYVVGTWNWRNTNFQHREIAWKKNLFNVLYGTMPMWNMTVEHWRGHAAEFVGSYKNIESVRSRIGFDEMVSHGWLTADRKVQFTDWKTGVRVVVNFRDEPFSLGSGDTVAARGFRVTTAPK